MEEHTDNTHEPVNAGGESVQAELNSRLRRTTRLTFFDDESGNEDMLLEPDDFHIVTGLVDKRGWPTFSNAKKFDGAWLGMVFKRGPFGHGLLQRHLQDGAQPCQASTGGG